VKNNHQSQEIFSSSSRLHAFDQILKLLNQVKEYDTTSDSLVRLIPTEGLMSPLQKQMFSSYQHERYLHAPPEANVKAIRYPDIGPLQGGLRSELSQEKL
jgi:hypothetical protein